MGCDANTILLLLILPWAIVLLSYESFQVLTCVPSVMFFTFLWDQVNDGPGTSLFHGASLQLHHWESFPNNECSDLFVHSTNSGIIFIQIPMKRLSSISDSRQFYIYKQWSFIQKICFNEEITPKMISNQSGPWETLLRSSNWFSYIKSLKPQN